MGKRFKVLAVALSVFAVTCVTAGEHWALKYALEYIQVEKMSELDEPVTEEEFYTLLRESVGNEIFHSNREEIAREDACAVIAEYLPDEVSSEYFFTDSEEISKREAIRKLYAQGIVDGLPDGSFRPRQALTRGEACKLMSRLEDVLAEELTPVRPSRSSVPSYEQTPQADPQRPVTPQQSVTPRRTTPSKPQEISFTAAMGSQFRGIDLTITAMPEGRLHYLILESGSPVPSVSEIISPTDEGLSGIWTQPVNQTITISETGGNGLVDGYNYDIYMVSEYSNGTTSEIAAVMSVMAMPFSAMNAETGTFTISNLKVDEINSLYPDLSAASNKNLKWIYQTARQLENIQRLADLYVSSDGLHGSDEFLRGGYTYVLSDDMDLSYYMAQNGESGWIPIGTRLLPFTGCLEGNGHTISGLYIDGSGERFNGLFGRIKNANIRNLVLDSPIVMAEERAGDGYTYAGSIAAESVDSIIEYVTVNSPKVMVYPTAEGMCAVGGVVGSAVNTDISHVTAVNTDISNTGGVSGVTGGIAGRYYINIGGKYLLSNLFASGSIIAGGKAGGGIAGTIDSISGDNTQIFANNIDSLVRVNGGSSFGGGIVGNVGYEALLSPQTRITFDNCYASGVIKVSEAGGGLFGKINSSVKDGVVVKNSASEADIVSVSQGAVMGGFVGEVHYGSFENCHSVGSGITAPGGDAGGFAGIVRGRTDFIGCITNRNVQADKSAGGFVGRQEDGFVKFYNCTSGGRVSGANAVGDFAGMLLSENEMIGCAMKPTESIGRLIGQTR